MTLRFVALPIAKASPSSRAFVYCLHTPVPSASGSGSGTGAGEGPRLTLADKVVQRAAKTWLSFEQAPGGWKRKLATWGNKVVDNIDYREHCLKSVPSKAAWLRQRPALPQANGEKVAAAAGTAAGAGQSVLEKLVVSHPTSVDGAWVAAQMRTLAAEGRPRHRSKMITSVVLAPFTAPFMLIPVLPNIPFFYLAYRAWSHYRAMQGAGHLAELLQSAKLECVPTKQLDGVYTAAGEADLDSVKRVLGGKYPEAAVELERAVKQIHKAEQQQQQQAQAAASNGTSQAAAKAEAETAADAASDSIASASSRDVGSESKSVASEAAAAAESAADAASSSIANASRADVSSAGVRRTAGAASTETAADAASDSVAAATDKDVSAASDASVDGQTVSKQDQEQNQRRARIGLHK